jgi:hypothetical protein
MQGQPDGGLKQTNLRLIVNVESDVSFNDWSTQDCITYVKLFFEKVMALCLFNLVMKKFIVNRHTAELT